VLVLQGGKQKYFLGKAGTINLSLEATENYEPNIIFMIYQIFPPEMEQGGSII